MDEEILCVAKWQKAQHPTAPTKKEDNESLPPPKIANGEAIFVRSKGAKAQHSKTPHPKKIANNEASQHQKSSMDEEILCVAKWQKAQHPTASTKKEDNESLPPPKNKNFQHPKIANGEAIFVRSKGAKAQHSSPM